MFTEKTANLVDPLRIFHRFSTSDSHFGRGGGGDRIRPCQRGRGGMAAAPGALEEEMVRLGVLGEQFGQLKVRPPPPPTPPFALFPCSPRSYAPAGGGQCAPLAWR